MTRLPDVMALETSTRDYAWGSPTVIPSLLGDEPTGAPVAELWVGAHPDLPSRRADHADRMPLDAVIAADPAGVLGSAAADRFHGRLPFLVKLLAAQSPLSLQAHPNLEQAQAGYAREQALGIPQSAPERSYRDDNHKPEMIVALSSFDALCGFRDPEVTARLLRALDCPELSHLADLVAKAPDLRAAVEFLLALDVDEARWWVRAAAQAARRYHEHRDESAPFVAETVWVDRLAAGSPDEIGPVFALLLNYVRIPPGNGLFLGAGQIHTYLQGFGLEVLANSDNVVRGGLTPKHVDARELVRILDFAPIAPELVPTRRDVSEAGGGRSSDAVRYLVPIDDFQLSRFDIVAGESPQPVLAPAAQLLVVSSGDVAVEGADGARTLLKAGASAFVPAGRDVTATGDGVLWRATTGPL